MPLLNSPEEFMEQVQSSQAAGQLMIVKFFSEECYACKSIAPVRSNRSRAVLFMTGQHIRVVASGAAGLLGGMAASFSDGGADARRAHASCCNARRS